LYALVQKIWIDHNDPRIFRDRTSMKEEKPAEPDMEVSSRFMNMLMECLEK